MSCCSLRNKRSFTDSAVVEVSEQPYTLVVVGDKIVTTSKEQYVVTIVQSRQGKHLE